MDGVLAQRDDVAREAERHVALGHRLCQKRLFAQAEACCREAIKLNPVHPMAHNNLGWTRQRKGAAEAAISSYQRALQLDPHLRITRRNLAKLLVQMGRRTDSMQLFYEELVDGPGGRAWIRDLILAAMEARDLSLAGEYAAILAALRWATPWYPERPKGTFSRLPLDAPMRYLTIPKLRHDIEQFCYLQSRGLLGDEFTTIIREYERAIDRLTPFGMHARVPLTSEEHRTIGHVYNLIVHVRNTPRVRRALSDKWDRRAVEEQYLNTPPGVVVVDDFLSNEALEGVRHFCLESTVWSGNRYAHGRLGAFFFSGFNCPLLLQIAEELGEALPRVIGDRYPLRQLWGFKYAPHLPADSTNHADFAAVNVNFWITPEKANLDASSGGLVIYDVDAPLSWNFDTYNRRADVIKPFLQRQGARATTIPYRQNRVIIFNSDLFHATAEVRFQEGYENRRVNVTMLYGNRHDDVHHPHQANEEPVDGPNLIQAAWRSAAFARTRRLRGA